MKKLAVLPLIVAMGLAVTACAKQADTDNTADANFVTSDETITDNDAASGDFATDNGFDLDNSAGTDATLDDNTADAQAADGNAL